MNTKETLRLEISRLRTDVNGTETNLKEWRDIVLEAEKRIQKAIEDLGDLEASWKLLFGPELI